MRCEELFENIYGIVDNTNPTKELQLNKIFLVKQDKLLDEAGSDSENRKIGKLSAFYEVFDDW